MGDSFSALSWFRRETVDHARVMVVGCGALGNEVLKLLAMFGLGHIVVVDFDSVERDNLCRSVLFSSEDASRGRLKVDAAVDGIHRINPKVEVVGIEGDAAFDVGLGLWSEMDVVISCVDSRWARYCINRNCMRVGVPWVDGGIGTLQGTARAFIPGRNCYACGLGDEGLRELRRRMPCSGVVRHNESAGRVATTPIISSIIAAVEVQEALKLLHPDKLEDGSLTSLCGHMFYYEGEHLSGRTVEFSAWDDDCPCHDRWHTDGRLDVGERASVGELLSSVRDMLPDETNHSVILRDDCFVDRVCDRIDGSSFEVMRPGRMVEEYVAKKSYIGKIGLSGLYQNEWRRLDSAFPYVDLRLEELGIPPRDIIHVETSEAEHFFELDAK